ncbi:hypothetical protein Pelo_6069 [Pelomyxa schiedti]|nr:hypothetical protein Pelo_6069 [Pelomyxa schiedti]
MKSEQSNLEEERTSLYNYTEQLQRQLMTQVISFFPISPGKFNRDKTLVVNIALPNSTDLTSIQPEALSLSLRYVLRILTQIVKYYNVNIPICWQLYPNPIIWHTINMNEKYPLQFDQVTPQVSMGLDLLCAVVVLLCNHFGEEEIPDSQCSQLMSNFLKLLQLIRMFQTETRPSPPQLPLQPSPASSPPKSPFDGFLVMVNPDQEQLTPRGTQSLKSSDESMLQTMAWYPDGSFRKESIAWTGSNSN